MRRATLAAAALALAALAGAPAAEAAPLQLNSGEVRIKLDRGLDQELRQEGVAVKALAKAKLQGRGLTIPVATGVFDEAAGTAALTPSGGLKLSAGGRGVALRKLAVESSKERLGATVAGRRIALASLARPRVERDGFGARLTAKRLLLSRAGASILNRALGLTDLLRPGRSLGSLRALGQPAAVPISYGRIIVGGPGTGFSRLEAVGGQIGLWGSTESWAAPGERFTIFDIAPTSVAPDASSGILQGGENDGITMQIYDSPARELLLRAPRIDLSTGELSATLSPISKESPVTGTIGTLDFAAAQNVIRPDAGVFELMRAPAIATQFAADQMNQRFATPGFFQAGETLALVTVNLSDG